MKTEELVEAFFSRKFTTYSILVMLTMFETGQSNKVICRQCHMMPFALAQDWRNHGADR